jgi:GNAT superfamily N-acetyltransferase
MNHHDLIYLADLNLAESIREFVRWRRHGEIFEKDDLLFVSGGDADPVSNSVIRLSARPDPQAEAVLKLVGDYFGKKQYSFSIHLRRHIDSDLEALCRSTKMALISESPGMAILEPVGTKTLPAQVAIRAIEDQSGAADFASVVIESYQSLGMPRETGEKIFENPERILKPNNFFLVAYWDEKPLSAAMIIFSHSIAGIYWVGTLERARKKGLGEACTAAVTNEAFRRGAAAVVLQASPFGEPIYRRLGFQEFTRYPWYMRFQKT